MRALAFLLAFLAGSACAPDVSRFGKRGSLSAPSGAGSFRFGTASSATQIEDQNTNTDWYAWTAPAPEGLGKGTAFVGEASRGYTRALEDIALADSLGLDSYRFSIEWARIEPSPGQYSEVALDHYDDMLDELVARGMTPMVTLHHYSWPTWVSNPRKPCDIFNPTRDCGLETDESYALLADSMGRLAELLAHRFGDRVDDWYTLNEPVNYVIAGYGMGLFPPGRSNILQMKEKMMPLVRRYFDLHARLAKALRAHDTVDADNDGQATSIGFGLSLQEFVPARDGKPSQYQADIAARDRLDYVMREAPIRFMLEGGFDADLDGTLEEPHPEWKGTLDWVGVQTYFRSGVTAAVPLIPVLDLILCFDEGSDLGLGACVEPLDESYWVPTMKYGWGPDSLYLNLSALSKRFPQLPLVVTENGIATQSGARRSELIVRSFEDIMKAQDEGADIRGYFHWTLTDNFEWHLGFGPQFGLFRVDWKDYSRIKTTGAETLQKIATRRGVSPELLKLYGGEGPLSPEKDEL